MWYLLTLIAGIVVGWVGCYFAIRNNPKYLDIDDILKGKRDDIVSKVRARCEVRLSDLSKKAHSAIDDAKEKIDDAIHGGGD